MNRYDTTPTELDRLLTDGRLAARDPLAPVQELVAEIYSTYATLPAPPPRADLARILHHEPQTLANVTGLSAARSRRRRGFARRYPARVLVAATIMGVAATTGLAAAQTLPGPIQRAVSGLADQIGFDLPDGSPIPTGHAVVTTAPSPDAVTGATANADPSSATAPPSSAPPSSTPDGTSVMTVPGGPTTPVPSSPLPTAVPTAPTTSLPGIIPGLPTVPLPSTPKLLPRH